MWCVSDLNPEFIERMEDLLALYERPLNPREPVVCLDERPVKLHGEKRKGSNAKPGRPARYDYEYVRKGTANIFCAVEPLAGKHTTKATATRHGTEFAKMLMEIARRYPKARTIHLVMDNLSTHFISSVHAHYGRRRGSALWRRFTVHYTPKHGSWLNQAEIEIGVMNRQCLGRRRIPTLGDLVSEVDLWNRRANRERQKITWLFTRKRARRRFGYTPVRTSRCQD
jgi:hypothetical protein